jgi:PAS domain S-box-containing protein
LFLGVSATRPDLGWIALMRGDTITELLARRLFPAVILVPLLLGWIFLQGARAGHYDPRDAVALFALASVVILGAVVWAGAAYAVRLGRQLELRERVFQTVVETALDAFVLMDQRGRVLEWNPEAERLFGWRREEAVGLLLMDLIVPPPLRAQHAKGLAHFLATGDSNVLRRRVEVSAERRDGGQFPVELMIFPARLGPEWVFSGFIKDLTAVKATEAQLRQSQKMEAVGQLTGGVAHDFNNLLTVIIATLDALLTSVSDEIRPRLEMALQAADRGAGMIRQLLAFSRRQTLSPEPLNLSHVVSSALDMIKRVLGEQIEIELRFASDAWRPLADRAQIESALLNLAINARDAMPAGGKLTIEVANATLDEDYAARSADVSPGDYVVLAVSDTGVGMTPEVVEHAFEPFFTTKEAGKGSGLGLSMIFGFAKQTGGHVKIYSEAGHGTTVRLYLPRYVEEGARAPKAAAIGEIPPSPRGGEAILVVEDDPHVRVVAVGLLRELGYHVLEATNAAEALALIENGAAIDLLFTDVVMPGQINGRQLAEAARRSRPRLSTLFTSGYADNAMVHHGRLDPGVNFLAKPYRGRDLAIKVRQALDRPT